MMPKVSKPTCKKKAIVLLSGGLDSVTLLALAKKQGFKCYALSFDYGQRHNAELVAATKIAADYQVEDHKIIKLGFKLNWWLRTD